MGEGPDAVVVTSAAWLGDEIEAQYFAPSPEREELDRLANLLVNISGLGDVRWLDDRVLGAI